MFLAKDRCDGRRVAIKVYHDDSDDSRKLFEHECRVLASDDLPRDLVVGYFHAVAEPRLQPYLVLEFIDGQKIHDYVRSPRPMTVLERVALWEKFCRALQRLHEHNLVFGDLSANNVLVQAGDVIRFVDMAGAKRLTPGYHSIQSSIPGGVTPGMVPAQVLSGETTTDRGTDLYAAAAIGFLMFTGRMKEECLAGVMNDRPAESWSARATAWDRELVQHDVPSSVRRMILKGLREPDPRRPADPQVYSTVEQMANDIHRWRERQLWRRGALRWAIPGLPIAGALVIVACIGWAKYLDERQSADLRRCDALRADVERLPNVSHSAIQRLLASVDESLARRQVQARDGDWLAAARTLRESLASLEAALLLSRDLERCEALLPTLSQILVGMPWVRESPAILKQEAELGDRLMRIRRELDSGRTNEAWAALVETHSDIAKLTERNLRAAEAQRAQRQYDGLKKSASDRLREQSVFADSERLASDALQAWDSADWEMSRKLYGQATQKLTKGLDPAESVEERLLHLTRLQETFGQREAELQANIEQLRSQRDHLQESLRRAEQTLKERDKEISHLGTQAKELGLLEKKVQELTQQVHGLVAERLRLVQQFRDSLSVVRPGQVPRQRSLLQVAGASLPFRWCPPGKFTMGSPGDETGREIDESQIEVTITNGFAMLETEVTQQMWQKIMRTTLRDERDRGNHDWYLAGEGADYPMYFVGHIDAERFCQRLNELLKPLPEAQGVIIRLPTEAEWEYAARANSTTRYFFGDDEAALTEHAWFAANANKQTRPVGQKHPNAWGLHDMAGNVWEWTLDYYADILPGGIDPATGRTGSGRISVRGGGWIHTAEHSRSASRSQHSDSYRWCDVGFRIVAVPER